MSPSNIEDTANSNQSVIYKKGELSHQGKKTTQEIWRHGADHVYVSGGLQQLPVTIWEGPSVT